ncbi:MAG TPA: LysR family transcriptional regulator, partial [Planctomycetota bacterium]|nr:LysR family transcriptional regulator [Planctomycetota bacterium]
MRSAPSAASDARPDPRPDHRPSVRQLECAVAVAEHLHFRRAAESLQLSQPALSA